MTPPRIRTRSGRRPRARFHASWSPASRLRSRRTLVRLAGTLGGFLLVMVIGVNVYAVSFLDSLPSVRDVDATQWAGDTLIQDRSGQLMADVGTQGDRRLTVNLDQVSPKLVQATVSIEDRTFWTNPGFDPEAIVRTAANNFRAGGIAGGGSTITQQLAKQLFLSPEQSIDRKLKEIVLAYQLTQTYSKRQILELYLNRSYYGSQQYGVQAAAETYFHKDAKSVDLAQAAMLAGLPQSPDAYSPVDHFDAAKARQRAVLEALLRDGAISAEEESAAWQEQLQVFPPVINYKAPHFVAYVESELAKLGFHPGQQQLVVRTTLDLGKQALAEQIVRDNLQKNLYRDRSGLLSSSLVAMDPKTGQILSYVGSPDINSRGGQYDFVGKQPINPGSSVKPFTYGKAILDGTLTMDTPICDCPSPLVLNLTNEKYTVYNYDKRSHGTIPARVALANSLNVPAVKVETAVGVPAEVDFFRQMGMLPRVRDGSTYGNPNAPDTAYGPSLTLGGYPITTLEEVSALSAYADMGIYHQPEAILQVTDLKGHVLYQADPNQHAHQAVDPGVAFIIASILSDDTNRQLIFGMGTPLHLPDRHAAAKTGTSEAFKDGLTIGFTPDLAAVVWIGDIQGTEHTMTSGSDGVYVAAPAWHAFMEGALKGVPDKWYTMPADVVPGKGNSFFLSSNPLKIDHLPGDDPSPSPSTSPGNGVPPDPGVGPRPLNQICIRGLPLPGCPSPSPLPPVGG
jgi:membrane peptidoglycan carboxypeptidase